MTTLSLLRRYLCLTVPMFLFLLGGESIRLHAQEGHLAFLCADPSGSLPTTSIGTAGCADPDSNYINASLFVGTFRPDPYSGYSLLSHNTDLQDIALAKYDKRGRMVWGRRIGAPGTTEIPHTIECDRSGNIYMAGRFGIGGITTGLTGNFDPDGFDSLRTQQGFDGFIAKYDPDGTYLWSFGIGQTGRNTSEVVSDIAIDSEGNIFAVGVFNGLIDFNPRGEPLTASSSIVSGAMFFARYNTDGICQWVGAVPISPKPDGSFPLPNCGLDGAGDLYISGNFSGDDVDFNPLGSRLTRSAGARDDMFIVKYDADDGNLIWVDRIGSNRTEMLCDMVVGRSGNVFIAGVLPAANDSVDMDPTGGEFLLYHPGYFYAEYDREGDLVRAAGIPSVQGDGRITSLGLDSAGVLVMAGYSSYEFGAKRLSGGSDAFVVMITDTIISTFAFGGNFSMEINSAEDVTIDAANNIVLTGQLYGDEADLDPGPEEFLLNASIRQNSFIAKYAPDGSLWTDPVLSAAPDPIATVAAESVRFTRVGNVLQVELGETPSAGTTLILTDLLGRESLRIEPTGHRVSVDLGMLPSGFYLAALFADGRTIATTRVGI